MRPHMKNSSSLPDSRAGGARLGRDWHRLLLSLLLLGISCAPAYGGLFDDAEARKAIIELQKQRQQMEARLAKLESTVQDLESTIKNLGVADLLSQVETLNNEINKLRGQIEIQNNQIDTAQKRQREFYLDLDTRLRTLEGGNAPPPKAESSGTETPSGTAAAQDKSLPALPSHS